jgi:dienelactone hydrolase
MNGPRHWLCTLSIALGLLIPSIAVAAPPQHVSFAGTNLMMQGWLYRPAQPGRHPAVVALHGCSGLTDKSGQPSDRHADWGQRLAALGYIVLFPDSYGSRGLGSQCKNDERSVEPSRERVADAKAGLAYLAARPDVKADAIALLGWSNGGSSVLYSVEPKNAPAQGPDFAKAVAFYPGCRLPLESGKWRSRVPLLILMGEADDWTPAAPCKALAAQAKSSGEAVAIVTYPGAYHDFDHPNLQVHVLSGLAFTADKSGAAHTGTNPAARADAIQRVPAFLAK